MNHASHLALVGLLICSLAVGCFPWGGAVQGDADFTGQVTDVQHVGKGHVVGTMLVEATVKADEGEYIDTYMVTVTDETLIFEERAGGRRVVTFETVGVGQDVQVWFAGPVKESYPMQGDARQMVVVR